MKPRHTALGQPLQRRLPGWGGTKRNSHAAGPATGSTIGVFFVGWLFFRREVFCCVAHICSIKCSSQTV